MYLGQLTCTQFKNYTQKSYSFCAGINLITGPNGTGKTNLLDAIYYLSMTKSAFQPGDTHNIHSHGSFFTLQGAFVQGQDTYQVRCVVQKGAKKLMQINGASYERLSDHLGRFPVVMIAPDDVDLVRGTSEDRRKFFDSVLCQLDKNYLNALLQYYHLLKQRASLLKYAYESNMLNRDLLATYDDQLLPLARTLFEMRQRFINQFIPYFQQHYHYLVDAEEPTGIVYESSLEMPYFETKFKQSLSRDLLLQRTNLGIHRDDYHFLLRDQPLKRIGSQGQKKSFVIALKLAQQDAIAVQVQIPPLLLLDDIFDKLDDRRIQRLIARIANLNHGQIFITDARQDRSLELVKALHLETRVLVLS